MFSLACKSTLYSILSNSLLAGLALFFPLDLLGADQPAEQMPPSERIETIDTPRDYLSGKFVGLASSIDRFFGDDRNFQESNTSVVQLDITRVTGYTGDHNVVLAGRAKLRLPSTEKRLHLLIETDPEKNTTEEPIYGQAAVTTPQSKVVKPGSYAAAVRYEKTKENRLHYSTDAGIQFHGITTDPNPFARARVSYSLPLDQWRLKLAETAFWFHTIGVGESTQLDMERQLSKPFLFRATSNATWLYEKASFDLRQDLSVYHTLNERTALLYQTSAIGVTQPQSHATDYVILMAYRYRLHRKWIFLELSPQLHFPREKDYRSSPMLIMRLEMLFDDSK